MNVHRAVTLPKNDIYECDLDGRKCGKGQEREGDVTFEATVSSKLA